MVRLPLCLISIFQIRGEWHLILMKGLKQYAERVKMIWGIIKAPNMVVAGHHVQVGKGKQKVSEELEISMPDLSICINQFLEQSHL